MWDGRVGRSRRSRPVARALDPGMDDRGRSSWLDDLLHRRGLMWRAGPGVAVVVGLALMQGTAAGSSMRPLLAPAPTSRAIDPAVPTAVEWPPAPPQAGGPSASRDVDANAPRALDVDEMAEALGTLRKQTAQRSLEEVDEAEEAEEAAEAAEEALIASGPPRGLGMMIGGGVLIGGVGLGSIVLGFAARALGSLCIDNCDESKGDGPSGIGLFAFAGISIAAGVVLTSVGAYRHVRWRHWRARVGPPTVQRSAAGTWTVGMSLRF
jgi:hypothetical protein